MFKRESISETIRAYRNGEYDKDRTGSRAKVKDLWWDWFCKESSLINKGRSLLQKLNQIADSEKIDADKTYVWFKNHCPGNGTLYTACQSATLRPKTLSIALSRNQDISVTREKHSCTAEKTASKPQLSKEHGKTSKTGSVTKRNNRPPEKAGGFFGEIYHQSVLLYAFDKCFAVWADFDRCGRCLPVFSFGDVIKKPRRRNCQGL